MTVFVTDRHLGGYVSGGDPATFYPELWTWLVREAGVKSVLDVGCGDAVALRYFESLGVTRLYGIDGISQPFPYVHQHDYTEGPLVPPTPRFDLCWACEFVEHVEEHHVPNFLATFQHADLVLLTHAEPGQGGHHHVNLQEKSYWVEVMQLAGFVFDARFTTLTRALASANDNPWNHYRRSGLAFRSADAP